MYASGSTLPTKSARGYVIHYVMHDVMHYVMHYGMHYVMHDVMHYVMHDVMHYVMHLADEERARVRAAGVQ